MTVTDHISAQTISEITSQLWCAVAPEQQALEPGDPAGPLDVLGWITARIEISGSSDCVVELRCSVAVARTIAGLMFSIPEAELAPEDVHDAVGELVNIVGGNLKSILPPPTSLSLPEVSELGLAPDLLADAACEASFRWMAEPVVVRLLDRTCRAPA